MIRSQRNRRTKPSERKSCVIKRSKFERGSSFLEFATILPIVAIISTSIIIIGGLIHMRIATYQAAYDCAFSAAQSLDNAQGYIQGVFAAQESFSSFGLPYGNADISVRGEWGRGGQIVCTIVYHIPVDAIPFGSVGPVPESFESNVTLPTQQYKSIWE